MSPPTSASIQLRVAVTAILMIGACTTPNPNYCTLDKDCGGDHLMCTPLHKCAPKVDTSVEPPTPDAAPPLPDAAPDRAETAAPDAAPDLAPTVDGAGTCSMDMECGAGRFCLSSRCVDCRTGMDADCKTSGLGICDMTNRCVECRTNAQCGAGKPLCTSGKCQPCTDDSACTGRPNTPACDKAPGTGACVECTADSHCNVAVAKPICDLATKKCGACVSDEQCVKKLGADPGVCMSHQDGHCATAIETTYVKAVGCVMPGATGGGTVMSPFCFPQDGVASALATNRRTVVLRGPERLTEINVAVTGAQLTIIGQKATIYPGARIGVRITAGNVAIRGLTVQASTLVGISVEGNSILRLNRSVLNGNAGGGLVVMGTAGFDVSNTVFDGNGPGAVGPVSFGGAFLGTNPTGVFRFNTVVNNMSVGVVCERPEQMLSGVLFFGNLPNDQAIQCRVSPNSKMGLDPAFSTDPLRPYRLTMASPCREAGGTADVPPDDIDGDARPQPTNGASDCGADELK